MICYHLKLKATTGHESGLEAERQKLYPLTYEMHQKRGFILLLIIKTTIITIIIIKKCLGCLHTKLINALHNVFSSKSYRF